MSNTQSITLSAIEAKIAAFHEGARTGTFHGQIERLAELNRLYFMAIDAYHEGERPLSADLKALDKFFEELHVSPNRNGIQL